MYAYKVNKSALRDAIRLLDEIDGDPLHPVNDARHPKHQACVQAYDELEQWCVEQNKILIKQRSAYSLIELV
jgi:hypothetical protein